MKQRKKHIEHLIQIQKITEIKTEQSLHQLAELRTQSQAISDQISNISKTYAFTEDGHQLPHHHTTWERWKLLQLKKLNSTLHRSRADEFEQRKLSERSLAENVIFKELLKK